MASPLIRLGRPARAMDVSYAPYVFGGSAWYTGVNTVAITANSKYNLTVNNPTGSGKNVILIFMQMYADSSLFFDMHLNPTTALPTTAQSIGNFILDGRIYGGVTAIKADTSATALSGGTETPFGIGVGPGAVSMIQGPIVLPPANMVGLHTLVANNTTFSLNIAFTEITI